MVAVSVPLTTTIVVPLITVVDPVSCDPGISGTVVEPVITSSVVPPMIVMLPGREGRAGTDVELGITKNNVPDTIDVVPTRPDGARDKGIVVGPGIRMKGVPETSVVLYAVRVGGGGSVVVLGTMI